MRTEEEVKKAIEFFLKQKKELPRLSSFGDNNWEILDYKIQIVKHQLSLKDINEMQEDGEIDEMQESDLMDVYDWYMGEDIDIFEE